MIVVLIAWIAVASVLGALIGTSIRRADAVEFPDRGHDAWWVVTPAASAPVAADEPSVAVHEVGLLAA